MVAEEPAGSEPNSIVKQPIATISNSESDELVGDVKAETPGASAVREEVAEIKREIAPVKVDPSLTLNNNEWLNDRLEKSRDWLRQANRDNVSIQVMMSRKSATKQLVDYLRNEWPLDLGQTYVFEFSTETQSIYRVFYREFDTLSGGQREIERLPESIRVNQPYLKSVHRMQEALL